VTVIIDIYCVTIKARTTENHMESQTFSLDELCTLTDFSKRTVRYYMQLGLVDRPIGETRSAHYLDVHLEQLLRIKKLTDAGVSLERIREVLAGEEPPVPARQRKPGSIEVKSHLFIAPGVELQISPEEADLSPEQVRELIKAIMVTAQQVLQSKEMEQK
jgi:DNA-binding transcriptional MerR regulator